MFRILSDTTFNFKRIEVYIVMSQIWTFQFLLCAGPLTFSMLLNLMEEFLRIVADEIDVIRVTFLLPLDVKTALKIFKP